jgi:low density lipoprotein receptor-related protein 5/6
MNGDEATRIILEEEKIYWPNALTVDYNSRLIYWADAKLQFIASMDYEGRNKRYYGEGKLNHPFAITFYRGKLFWSDWHPGSIQVCELSSGCEPKVLANWKDPFDLQIWDLDQQPWSKSPCHDRNGGCSDLCLAAPTASKYACACPTGVRKLNETTCGSGYERFLLLARRPEVRIISFDTAEHMSIILPISHLSGAKVVDFDPVSKRVYWIEERVSF